jgi:hypothetical protein
MPDLATGLPAPQAAMPWDNMAAPTPAAPTAQPPASYAAYVNQQAAAGKEPAFQGGAAPPKAPAAPADPLAGVMAKIASGESGGDDNARYGFPDLPGAPGPAGTSHALRKYQFEPGTWETAAKAWAAANPGKPPPDFNRPQDEEAVARFWAVQTYRQNTGRDLAADAAAGKVDYSALAGQWPSLGKPSLKASWGQLSPEENALMQQRQGETAASSANMTAMLQQYAATANAAPEGSKEREAAIAQLRANSQEMMADWRKKVMNPPIAHPIDAWKNMGSAGFILAALAGLLSRQHMTAGLLAGGNALKAINQNSQEEFQRQYQMWKDQVSLGTQMISMENEDIKSLLEDQKMSIEEKQARLSTMAHEMGFIQAIGQNNIGNIDAHAQFLARREQAAQAFQVHMDTLEQTAAYRHAMLTSTGTAGKLDASVLNQWKAEFQQKFGRDPTADETAAKLGELRGMGKPASPSVLHEQEKRLDAADSIDSTMTLIQSTLPLISTGSTGFTGQASRIAQGVAGQFGVNLGTNAPEVEQNLALIQAQIRNELIKSHYMSKGAIEAMTDIAPGFDKFDDPVSVRTRLTHLLQILQQEKARLGSAPGAATKQTYHVGDIITHNGKKYRVTGGDMSDPTIEEVKP